MYTLRNLVRTILMCFALCSCAIDGDSNSENIAADQGNSQSSDDSCPEKDQSWTFLFYIVADDGSQGFDGSTVRDLNTMPSLPENVEALILLDRCSVPLWPVSTTTGPLLDSCAQLYRIQRDGGAELLDTAPHKLNWLQGVEGDLNMGSADTLSRFILFGMEYSDTTNYGLIISGHGNGDQVGFDSTNDSSLNHPEVAFAFNKALTTLAQPCQPKLDMVVMAACAMATAGMYTSLSPHVDWLIASQENIYGYDLAWMHELGAHHPEGNISKSEISEALKNARIDGETGTGQQVTLMLSEDMAQTLETLVTQVGAALIEDDFPRSDLEDASFNPRTYDLRLVTEKIQDAQVLEQVDALLEQAIFEQTELSEGMRDALQAHGISVTTSDLGLPGSLLF